MSRFKKLLTSTARAIPDDLLEHPDAPTLLGIAQTMKVGEEAFYA